MTERNLLKEGPDLEKIRKEKVAEVVSIERVVIINLIGTKALDIDLPDTETEGTSTTKRGKLKGIYILIGDTSPVVQVTLLLLHQVLLLVHPLLQRIKERNATIGTRTEGTIDKSKILILIIIIE